MKIKIFVMISPIIFICIVLYSIASGNKPTKTFPISANIMKLVGSEDKNFSFDEAKGRVYLVNFFATWCKMCLKEHKYLVSLSKELDVPIYGVVIRDDHQNIDRLLSNFGNPYELVIEDDGDFSHSIPVKGLPTTILVDQNGQIVTGYSGSINPDIFKKHFRPMINEIGK